MLSLPGSSVYAQQVSISGKNISFEKVLKEIRKQTGYNYVCKDEWMKAVGSVSIDLKNASIETVLDLCLTGKLFTFTIEKKMIAIIPAAVNIDVSGKVVDNESRPMAGVSVTIRDGATGTSTDASGAFSMAQIDPQATLVFSYVGFNKVQEKINGRSRLLIRLEPENKLLEVATVSNGYQKIQQNFLTGSVTSLKMDSIIQPGLNTVDKMLEGRVPGLTFIQNSGQSGAVPKLRIRGTSTILGSREPLWVVDGIIRTDPFPVPAERINDLDFVNLLGNSISGLNPYDIDQIDVLKDATAAALYGVRAANGVIVITTKRGKPGPPVINYNVTGTYTRRPRYSGNDTYLMNSRERVDVSREMIDKKMTMRGGVLEGYEKIVMDYYNGLIDYDTYRKMVDRAETMNTDWFDILTRDVFTTNHSLSISGGNPNATYRASVGYSSEPGVIKNEENKRYTALMNLRLSGRNLKADFNIQLNKGDRRYTPQDLGILNYAYNTSRAIPLYNEDGSLHYYSNIGYSVETTPDNLGTGAFNVLNELQHAGNIVATNEYVASANLNYNIAEGMQLNATLAYTGGNSENRIWYDDKTDWVAKLRYPAMAYGVYNPAADPIPFGGELQQESVKRKNYTISLRGDFSRYLDGNRKHLLNAAAGWEMNSASYNGNAQLQRGYLPDRGESFAVINPFEFPSYGAWLYLNGQPKITLSKQNLLRVLATTTYVYDDRYVLTASGSSDYSNAFGSRSNERFLPTWAVSARWNMHNDILRSYKWIDMAALRLSYGTQGNMLPDQSPNTIINKGPIDGYYGVYTSTLEAFPNPGLAWEKVQDYGAGIDFSFLNGKIGGTFAFFYKKTSNAFLTKTVSTINGAASYVVNGGTLENHGVELALHFRPVNNAGANKRGFMWRIDPQLGQVFNRLLNRNLNSRNVLVDPNAVTYDDFLKGTVPVDGKSINTFFSYQFKGLDPEYGFPVFYMAEPGNAKELFELYSGLSKLEMYKTVMIESGRREPVIQGGINNSFAYRNWTLSFTFTYSLGNKIRLLQIASGNYGTFRPTSQQNLRKEFVNRWQYPGDELNTNIPGIQGNEEVDADRFAWWLGTYRLNSALFASDYYQMYDFSDLRVVKGDYLKLQFVSIGYTFSKELCQRWRVKGANININGSNLFTIANKALRGQDPSQSGSAPNINLAIRPVYAVNFNLSF